MNNLLKYALSIFKTIYFNFKVLDYKKALKMPILISYSTKIYDIHKNSICINSEKIETAMIKIGFGGTDFIASQKSSIKVEKGAKIEFKGKAFLSEGIAISVEKDAVLTFGENFSCNKNCMIYSCKKIDIGNDILLGWNVNIRDNDGHTILHNNQEKINKKEITIKNNVWIGSYVDILKGVLISENSIVATRSCVTKKFDTTNILIGGYPAKIIEEDVSWKK